MNVSFSAGLRLGAPYALVGAMMSFTLGVLCVQAGFSVLQTIVASVIIFAGSAQFAALAVVTSGGSVAAAIAAGSLMNSRFLAMGMALAPSLPGGPVKRTLQGQAVVDSSWVHGSRPDGSFDRWTVFGSTAPQFVAWTTGTAAGAFAGDVLRDPQRFGLDAIFPTFFLGLLIAEMARPRRRIAALLGGGLALALVPFSPPGIPILAASLGALVALAGSGGAPAQASQPDGPRDPTDPDRGTAADSGPDADPAGDAR